MNTALTEAQFSVFSHILKAALILKQDPSKVYDTHKYNFRCRARQILQKWNNFLLLDVPNRRWALKGKNTLVYIPTDDRKSPLAVSRPIL